jgi:hypothetical protein
MPSLREVAALILFLAVFLQLLLSLWIVTRRGLGALLPIAAAVFIGVEAVLFNTLSLFRGVRAVPVVACNLALVFVLARYQVRHAPHSYSRFLSLMQRGMRSWRVELMVAPLVVLLAITAYVYPPTNWDSMTYHMARVAHWMQNRSVSYYPAIQPAQNTMGPGMEYLLLLLQIVSFSDRWANLVQWFAYCGAMLAIPTLCRIVGMPRKLCPWMTVFVASVPLMTLEATTTQNDIVAGLMTLAVVSAALPLLKRSSRGRVTDVALLAACASATYLVKPTATLAAIPIAVVASVATVVKGVARPRALLAAVSAALMLVLIVLGPDAYRKITSEGSMFAGRNEIYPVAGQWSDRAFNSIRGYCQHAYSADFTSPLIQKWDVKLTGSAAPLFCHAVYWANEDHTGNPLHALTAIGLVVCLLILAALAPIARLRPWRVVLIGATVLAAWVLFHAFVRNQDFLARLQIPLFMTSPLLWPAFTWKGIPWLRLRAGVLGSVVTLCAAFAYVPAVTNFFRPPSIDRLRSVDREAGYYATRGELRAPHDSALAKVGASGCRRLGLFIEPQGFDYPLTWRAMQSGITVRPYAAPSQWPCLVYSERGEPPSTESSKWVEAGSGLWTQTTPP